MCRGCDNSPGGGRAENTPFSHIVREMREFGINSVPVVDSTHRVLGMVAASDLMVNSQEPFQVADAIPTVAEGPVVTEITHVWGQVSTVVQG